MLLTVFEDQRRIASGTVADVAAAMQASQARGASPLALNSATGRVVDLDLRGTPAEIAARHQTPAKRGRPRLGVTAREVTLLPRHWDWLSSQRGGASATLRKLVETAMRADGTGDAGRHRAQEAAYTAATALAGDLPGYEEAMRALFSDRLDDLVRSTSHWPPDIRAFVLDLAGAEP